jgi:tRNA(fMet)-specific endonuclease VapC
VLATPLESLAISIITVEEILRGGLDTVRRAQSRKRLIVEAYTELSTLYTQLHRLPFLSYSREAERIFESFPASVKRIGINDCRIAAIAITSGNTLVTGNESHFRRVPGLSVENWMLD